VTGARAASASALGRRRSSGPRSLFVESPYEGAPALNGGVDVLWIVLWTRYGAGQVPRSTTAGEQLRSKGRGGGDPRPPSADLRGDRPSSPPSFSGWRSASRRHQPHGRPRAFCIPLPEQAAAVVQAFPALPGLSETEWAAAPNPAVVSEHHDAAVNRAVDEGASAGRGDGVADH
jgi:hypothetical protein